MSTIGEHGEESDSSSLNYFYSTKDEVHLGFFLFTEDEVHLSIKVY